MTMHSMSRRPRAGGPRRRRLGLALLAGALLPLAARADFPERPVRIVVNFPPGGPLDIVARELAARLAAQLRQPFVVENVSGAAGNIGAAQVARAQPDGHTLLMSIDAPFTMAPALYPATSLKPEELRVVATMGVTGSTVAVHPSLGVRSLQELVDKGRRGSITFATAGNGSPGHFAVLMLAEASGMQVQPIHYRGNAPAVMAVVGGEVQAGILGTSGLLPHIRADKVQALAAAGTVRPSLLPELRTAAELGQGGLELESLFVTMAPARTPDDVVEALQRAIAQAVAQPDFQERLRSMDIAPLALGGAQAAARLAQARTRYAQVVQRAGLKGE